MEVRPFKPSYGTRFILVNDVRQDLDPKIFKNGPWVHLATVKWGFKEFVCFTHKWNLKRTYIEEIDPLDPTVFKKIEDIELWKDLFQYLVETEVLLLDKFKLKTDVKE